MRVALGIEYDGSAYFGWQRQAEVDSVQQQLSKRCPLSPMNLLQCNVQAAQMPECMQQGKWFILKLTLFVSSVPGH